MPIKSHEEIFTNEDGVEVKVICSTFPATLGLGIGTELIQFMGGFTKMGAARVPVALEPNAQLEQGKSFLDADVNFDKVAEVLTTHLNEKKVTSLILRIMAFTRVNGEEVSKKPVFDNVFSGDYALLIDVVKFTLQVNFKSFFAHPVFGRIRSTITALISKMTGETEEIKTGLQESSEEN